MDNEKVASNWHFSTSITFSIWKFCYAKEAEKFRVSANSFKNKDRAPNLDGVGGPVQLESERDYLIEPL